MLEQLGATVIEAPDGPHRAARGLRRRWTRRARRVGQFDWIVFTSVNGVDYFFQRLQAGPSDTRALTGVRLCAIGPGTAERLAQHGLKVDLMPGGVSGRGGRRGAARDRAT